MFSRIKYWFQRIMRGKQYVDRIKLKEGSADKIQVDSDHKEAFWVASVCAIGAFLLAICLIVLLLKGEQQHPVRKNLLYCAAGFAPPIIWIVVYRLRMLLPKKPGARYRDIQNAWERGVGSLASRGLPHNPVTGRRVPIFIVLGLNEAKECENFVSSYEGVDFLVKEHGGVGDPISWYGTPDAVFLIIRNCSALSLLDQGGSHKPEADEIFDDLVEKQPRRLRFICELLKQEFQRDRIYVGGILAVLSSRKLQGGKQDIFRLSSGLRQDAKIISRYLQLVIPVACLVLVEHPGIYHLWDKAGDYHRDSICGCDFPGDIEVTTGEASRLVGSAVNSLVTKSSEYLREKHTAIIYEKNRRIIDLCCWLRGQVRPRLTRFAEAAFGQNTDDGFTLSGIYFGAFKTKKVPLALFIRSLMRVRLHDMHKLVSWNQPSLRAERRDEIHCRRLQLVAAIIFVFLVGFAIFKATA